MSRVENEVGTKAFAGKRQLTLDPVMDREPLAVEVVRPESTLPCGLRVEWLSGRGEPGGSDEGVTFTLSTGAGVGGRHITLHVERDGETVADECVDIVAFTQQWVASALKAGPTPRREDTTS